MTIHYVKHLMLLTPLHKSLSQIHKRTFLLLTISLNGNQTSQHAEECITNIFHMLALTGNSHFQLINDRVALELEVVVVVVVTFGVSPRPISRSTA